jgi:hypothetical protein
MHSSLSVWRPSGEMQDVGQASAQRPHSMQASLTERFVRAAWPARAYVAPRGQT